MSNPWDGIADSLLGTIKDRAKKFWDEQSAAKDLIADRTKELAKLIWQYKTESDEAKKSEIHDEMRIVQQTIENELSAVALVGAAESKALFKEMVGSAVSMIVKALPVILAAI